MSKKLDIVDVLHFSSCGGCREAIEEIERLRGELHYYQDFMAGSSLCEGCQQKREERRIIATPRIQVEEERDSLRARIAELEGEIRAMVEEATIASLRAGRYDGT